MSGSESKVFLVGAGPGAADLLTLRAARLLQQADIVFYDALVHADTLALAGTPHKIAVGKRSRLPSTEQSQINRLLIEAAASHRCIVRLKGGDPMLFGRAQEEIDALQQAGIAYEVVPGVSAAFAASAQLGVSLTRRGVARTVALATARVGSDEQASDWVYAVAHADTAVLYMGLQQADAIAAALLAAGRPASTPIAIVESASWPQSRTLTATLGELPRFAQWRREGPALLMIGEVYGVVPR